MTATTTADPDFGDGRMLWLLRFEGLHFREVVLGAPVGPASQVPCSAFHVHHVIPLNLNSAQVHQTNHFFFEEVDAGGEADMDDSSVVTTNGVRDQFCLLEPAILETGSQLADQHIAFDTVLVSVSQRREGLPISVRKGYTGPSDDFSVQGDIVHAFLCPPPRAIPDLVTLNSLK